jgi:hypothetical protein
MRAAYNGQGRTHRRRAKQGEAGAASCVVSPKFPSTMSSPDGGAGRWGLWEVTGSRGGAPWMGSVSLFLTDPREPPALPPWRTQRDGAMHGPGSSCHQTWPCHTSTLDGARNPCCFWGAGEGGCTPSWGRRPGGQGEVHRVLCFILRPNARHGTESLGLCVQKEELVRQAQTGHMKLLSEINKDNGSDKRPGRPGPPGRAAPPRGPSVTSSRQSITPQPSTRGGRGVMGCSRSP